MPAKISEAELEVCVRIILRPEEAFICKDKSRDDKEREIFDSLVPEKESVSPKSEEPIEKRVDKKMAFEKMSDEAKEVIRAIFGVSKNEKANGIAEAAFTQKRVALPTGKKIICQVVPGKKRKQKRVLEEIQWFCRNFL